MEDKARVYLSAAKADIEHLLRVAPDMDPDVRANSVDSAIQSLRGVKELYQEDVGEKIDALTESSSFDEPPEFVDDG